MLLSGIITVCGAIGRAQLVSFASNPTVAVFGFERSPVSFLCLDPRKREDVERRFSFLHRLDGLDGKKSSFSVSLASFNSAIIVNLTSTMGSDKRTK